MRFVASSLIIAVAAVASAQSAYMTGTLTLNSPRYNRLSSTTTLSAVGTAVAYDAKSFTVSASGTYTLEMASPSGFDTHLDLYAGSFAPTSPLTNIVNLNDDFTGTFTVLPGPYTNVPSTATGSTSPNYGSRFTQALTAGTTYIAVYTAFYNATATTPGLGTYYGGIGGGPGAVSFQATPEPTTLAALGLGVLGLARRRRQA